MSKKLSDEEKLRRKQARAVARAEKGDAVQNLATRWGPSTFHASGMARNIRLEKNPDDDNLTRRENAANRWAIPGEAIADLYLEAVRSREAELSAKEIDLDNFDEESVSNCSSRTFCSDFANVRSDKHITEITDIADLRKNLKIAAIARAEHQKICAEAEPMRQPVPVKLRRGRVDDFFHLQQLVVVS